MRYSIEFVPSARRALAKLPLLMRKRIQVAIDDLADNPLPPGVKKLQGEDGYRIRVGDYRVIYEVEHVRLTILVIRIGHRREVYR
ncbi:MAG: type II toxin-antitoxin system RelE/ParE family toxin [Terriglobales bacterium]